MNDNSVDVLSNVCENYCEIPKFSGKIGLLYLSLVVRKPVFGVSDQVRHKLGCTTTEDV